MERAPGPGAAASRNKAPCGCLGPGPRCHLPVISSAENDCKRRRRNQRLDTLQMQREGKRLCGGQQRDPPWLEIGKGR